MGVPSLKAGLSKFVFDDKDKLYAIETPDKKVVNLYGPSGQRKKRVGDDGVKLKSFYSGLPTLSESSSEGDSFSWIMAHGVAGFELNGSFSWFITDGLGSVRVLVDGDGDEIAAVEFDEFGNKIATSGSGSTSKTFVGGLGVIDETTDTGLYLMSQRWMDPTLGRFLNRDPIGYAGGLNMFAYAGNNPTTLVDISGAKPARPYGPFHLSPNGLYRLYDSGWTENTKTGDWQYFAPNNGVAGDISIESATFVSASLGSAAAIMAGDPTEFIKWDWIGDAVRKLPGGLRKGGTPCPKIRENYKKGKAFEEAVLKRLNELGYNDLNGFVVEAQVYFKTKLGRRFLDVVVRHGETGKRLFGLELKHGRSRYSRVQRAKDKLISEEYDFPIHLIRWDPGLR